MNEPKIPQQLTLEQYCRRMGWPWPLPAPNSPEAQAFINMVMRPEEPPK